MSSRGGPPPRSCASPSSGKKKLPAIRHLCVLLLSGSLISGFVALCLTSSAIVQSYGGEHARTTLGALVGANCFMVVSAGFGLAGLIRKSIKMMKLSFSLLVLVGILYAGVGVFAHLKLKNLKIKLSRAIKNFMDLYGSQLGRLHNGDEVLDDIQQKRHCCGADSPMDWEMTKFGKIPPSCCFVPEDCVSLVGHNVSFQDLQTVLRERNEETTLVKPLFSSRGCVEPMTELYQVANNVIVPSAGCLSALALTTFALSCTYFCIFVNSFHRIRRQNTLPGSQIPVVDPAGEPIVLRTSEKNRLSGTISRTGSDVGL